jgi:glucose-induced degradation protein 8
MALLIFPQENLEPQLAALLKPDLRKSVADRVNKAILANQGQRRDAAIRNLVRLRAWTEDSARESKKDLPAHLDLGLDSETRNEDSELHENGNEAMVT